MMLAEKGETYTLMCVDGLTFIGMTFMSLMCILATILSIPTSIRSDLFNKSEENGRIKQSKHLMPMSTWLIPSGSLNQFYLHITLQGKGSSSLGTHTACTIHFLNYNTIFGGFHAQVQVKYPQPIP